MWRLKIATEIVLLQRRHAHSGRKWVPCGGAGSEAGRIARSRGAGGAVAGCGWLPASTGRRRRAGAAIFRPNTG
eukprot:COSAG01_NODE_1250_length_11058_cov_35.299845_3_plen_74_part_00